MKIHILILIVGIILGTSGIIFQTAVAQVDANRDLAIVSINRYVNNIPTGTVYFYDENYTLIKILESPETVSSGQFDGKIIFHNNQIILATYSRDDVNATPDSGPLASIGAISIFDATTGDFIKTIWNPHPNKTPEHVGGTFGDSVEIVGDKIVIGNSANEVNGVQYAGTVYIYDINGNLQNTIDNPKPSFSADFGTSLSSLGDKMIIGIPGETIGKNDYAGAIAIVDSKTGNILQTIKNPNPSPFAKFGFAMDAGKTKLVVSAPFAIVGGKENVGEVYLFDADSGTLLKTIENPDPDEGDMFGRSVLFAGDTVVVGATGDGTREEGSVYIFDAESGRLLNSIPSPQRTPKEGFYSNEFGVALAYDGNRLAIGDDSGMINNTRAGIAYVFEASSGKLLKTIENPIPEPSDSFGYYLEFVGKIEPSSKILFEQKFDKVDDASLEPDNSEKTPPMESDPTETKQNIAKNIQWLDENGANYSVGGIGVIRLDNSDLNANKTLIDIPQVHVWSDTDKEGIPVDIIETGVNTGVFYADINLSASESSHLQLQVSDGNTITVSFDDKNSGMVLLDSIKLKSKYFPPLKQIKSGISLDKIQCREGLELIIRLGDQPTCLRHETISKLAQRGIEFR